MHEDLANSVNHQTWEILSVKLGNSSIKQGGGMSLQTWGVRDFNTKHRKDCEARVQDEENGNIFQES